MRDWNRRRKRRAGGKRNAARRRRKAQAVRRDAGSGAAMRTRSWPSRGRSMGDPAIRRSGDPAIRRSGDPAIRRSGDPAIRRSGDPAIRRSGDPAIIPGTANRLVKRIFPAADARAAAIFCMLPIIAKSPSPKANPEPPQRGSVGVRTNPSIRLVPIPRAEGKPSSAPVSARGVAWRSPSSSPVRRSGPGESREDTTGGPRQDTRIVGNSGTGYGQPRPA